MNDRQIVEAIAGCKEDCFELDLLECEECPLDKEGCPSAHDSKGLAHSWLARAFKGLDAAHDSLEDYMEQEAAEVSAESWASIMTKTSPILEGLTFKAGPLNPSLLKEIEGAGRPGGSTPSQYALPVNAVDLQDLIEYRGMSFSEGNIFKAVYRLGQCDHSSRLRDLRKIAWFTERLIKLEESDD